MMVGVIVLFAKEHEPATPQAVNQGITVDKFARCRIPDPPHDGMILPERCLPQFSRWTTEHEPSEERPEHEGTRSSNSRKRRLVVQSSHFTIPAATSSRPIVGRRQIRHAAAAPVPVFHRRPLLLASPSVRYRWGACI